MTFLVSSKKENLLELKSEINGKLKSKFLRVHLSGKYYCFKVLFIKELFHWNTNLKEIIERRKDGTNIYGIIKFRGKHVPVIDCMRNNSELFDSSAKGYLIIADILGKGMVQELGILLSDPSDIFQMAMDEISLTIN